MYLNQIVAWNYGTGKCGAGASESAVIRDMMKTGMSEFMAKLEIDLAVRYGTLKRTCCQCQ